MNRLLTILLLAAGTVCGQIDNPPNSANIVDATTVGRAVLTASNAAAARSAIEVTLTNLSSTPTLTALTNTGNSVLGTNSTNTVTVGGNLLVGGSIAVTNAATTRTNLGLGSTNSVAFANLSLSNGALTNLAITLGATNRGFFATSGPDRINTVVGGVSALTVFSSQIEMATGLAINGGPLSFSGDNAASNLATTRTNLGFPLAALTNTSNVTTMRALAGSTNTNQPFSGSIALTNTNTLVFSNGILLSQ